MFSAKTLSLAAPAAIAALALFPGPAAMAQTAARSWSLSPSLTINYDWLRVEEDARPFPDEDDFRRARIGLTLKGSNGWILRGEHDVEERTAPELSLEVPLGEGRQLRFGQFKHPFLLDDVTSDKQSPLMEGSLAIAYAVNRRLGMAYGQSDAQHSFDVSVFDQRLDGRFEGTGVAARYTRVLSRSSEGLFHLGGSLALDDPRNGQTRWGTRPESGIASVSLADTGTLTGVDRNQRAAIDALWLHGPWSLQAEHVLGQSLRSNAPDFHSDASYALLSWSPSGHQRSYKAGVVGSPKAGEGERPWELFLRYSRIDLDDGPAQGGRERDWTLGTTWYPHPRVRLLANWTHVRSHRRGASDDPQLLQFRVQIAY